MSGENVQVVEKLLTLEPGQAARAARLHQLRALVAADAEWRPIVTAGGDLERPVYRGPEGWLQYGDDLEELLDDLELHLAQLEAVDARHVLFGGHVTGRARASGVPFDQRLWALYEVRHGQVVRGAGYRSREEALRAVALST